MENREKAKITLNELPPRAEKTLPEKLSHIFGGAYVIAEGSACNHDCNCPDGYKCKENKCTQA